MRAPRENAIWMPKLRACGPVQAEAITDLRGLLLRGLAKSFQARGVDQAFLETDITCTCGATVHTRSTVPNMRVAVCSNCHPFFTGRQKMVDTTGRVEAFRKKFSVENTLCPQATRSLIWPHSPLSPDVLLARPALM